MQLNITIHNSTVTINTPSQHTLSIEKLIETSNITTNSDTTIKARQLEKVVQDELLRAIKSAEFIQEKPQSTVIDLIRETNKYFSKPSCRCEACCCKRSSAHPSEQNKEHQS